MGLYNIKGLSKVLNDLKAKGKAVEDSVIKEVTTRGMAIEAEASRAANTISGKIAIDGNNKNPLKYEIQARWDFAGQDIAAYIEFGTGTYAGSTVQAYPQDVKDLAMTFYKNGQGRMPSRPYLIPTYLRNRQLFLNNLKKIVKGIK